MRKAKWASNRAYVPVGVRGGDMANVGVGLVIAR